MSATTYYRSPLGWIEIRASHDAVTSLVFCNEQKNEVCSNWLCRFSEPGSSILTECVHQLDEYFSGRLTKFDLPVMQNGTKFQRDVWKALMDIPFGKTVSYGDVAKMLDNPKAVRAVGAANGNNGVWIVVPCHRVIGADGSLTGYAGGLDRKKWLLAHEERKVSSLKFEVSSSEPNLKLQPPNLKLQTSNFKPQTSNFKPQTSN
jgi:methylated-DNA-[protein]-cysteine S-methyltransferase